MPQTKMLRAAAICLALCLPCAAAPGAQTVYLDFDTFTTGGKYVYTPADRGMVAAGLFDIYAGFDITFSTTVPAGPHSTIFFNFGDGPYGGTSDHIDFLNVDKTDDAYVLAPPLLAAFGLPTTPSNILLASANLGAHELGHILGMKHQDGMGPLLSGISVSPAAYEPPFPGPTAGSSFNHVMGLSSSMSLSAATLVSTDTHLNFREAIKLKASETGGIPDPETIAPHFSPATAQPLVFTPMVVPNTMIGYSGGHFFTEPTYSVLVNSIEGTISPDPTLPEGSPLVTDYYSFTGSMGEIATVEVFSESIAHRLADTTNPVVFLLDGMGLPIDYYSSLAVNNNEFESSDSILLDVRLPYSGTYYIEVGPLSGTDLLLAGAYQLYVTRFEPVPEPSTWVLGGVAGVALAFVVRRRRRSADTR